LRDHSSRIKGIYGRRYAEGYQSSAIRRKQAIAVTTSVAKPVPVGIPTLADAEQRLFASGGVFTRNQPRPGSELSAFTKGRPIADRRYKCSGCEWTNAGDRIQTSAHFVLLRRFLNQRIGLIESYRQLIGQSEGLARRASQSNSR
jgi:hypothetical protein